MAIVNSQTILPILQAVQTICWPGTRIQPTNVYVQQTYKMAAGPMPAINVVSGRQRRQPDSYASWIGGVPVSVRLYDFWEQQNKSIDDIWAALDADREIVIANLSSNPSLVVGNVPLATSIQHLDAPGYAEGIVKETIGIDLVLCEVTFAAGLLPYGVP